MTVIRNWFAPWTLLIVFAAGCGQNSSAPPATGEKPLNGGNSESTAASSAEKSKSHSHAGWWCDEHGVPEEVCGQCNSKVAAEFQKKGDWCKEHDRPDSQCFVCHPELEARFAAQYEAKYGKKPPKPEG